MKNTIGTSPGFFWILYQFSEQWAVNNWSQNWSRTKGENLVTILVTKNENLVTSKKIWSLCFRYQCPVVELVTSRPVRIWSMELSVVLPGKISVTRFLLLITDQNFTNLVTLRFQRRFQTSNINQNGRRYHGLLLHQGKEKSDLCDQI